MILVGQYDSPFVRRVAIALHYYDMQFERRVLSVFSDLDKMLQLNPLGKVPALALDIGEVLIDSQFILDYLDGIVDAERALVPPAGAARREVLNVTAIAMGLAEKAVALRWELHRRRPQSIDPDWVERLQRQVTSCLSWLEARALSTWLSTTQMTLADVTTVVAYTYLWHKHKPMFRVGQYPRLDDLATRCEALPEFMAAPYVEG